MYICVGALGPILGVGFSGCIFDKIGGYHGRNTPIVFTLFIVIAACFAVVSVLFMQAYVVSLCIML